MAGRNAFGTKFERGDGTEGSETFEALANVTNIAGPELSRETIDTTAHDTADAWREFIGSLKDGGEVSLDLNYDPNKHDELVADLDDAEPRSYRLVFPVTPAVAWTIKAVMTGFSSEAPIDDKLSASVTFKVSGKPSIGAPDGGVEG